MLIVVQVYGTKNLRVVDLSVLPLHMAAHPQGLRPEYLDYSRAELTFVVMQGPYMPSPSKVLPTFFQHQHMTNTFCLAADIIKGKV